MKICSASLVIKEMLVRAMVKYHFTYNMVYVSTYWSVKSYVSDMYYSLNSVTDTEDIFAFPN